MNNSLTLFGQSCSVHTFELSKYYQDCTEYQSIKKAARKQYDTGESGNRIDISEYQHKGIRISLVDRDDNTGTVYVTVNPQRLIHPGGSCGEIIESEKKNWQKVSREFEKVFRKSPFLEEIDNYTVQRVDLCCNLQGKRSTIREYLRLLKKAGTPASAEQVPFYDKRLDKKENRACGRDYYRLKHNSEYFVVYDKIKQATRCGLSGIEELPKGLLRVELQLRRKALRKVEKQDCVQGIELIRHLADQSADRIMEKIASFFPQGVYYHRKSLQNRILRSDYKWTLKRHMLQYVGLCKKHGEDKAAQITKNRWHWSQGQYRKFREKFEVLGIQPVPLRKNFHGDTLPSFGTCLHRLLGKDGK